MQMVTTHSSLKTKVRSVVWNMNLTFPYIGNNNPNWRTHIFQRSRYTTNQIYICIYIICIYIYNMYIYIYIYLYQPEYLECRLFMHLFRRLKSEFRAWNYQWSWRWTICNRGRVETLWVFCHFVFLINSLKASCNCQIPSSIDNIW